MTRPQPLHLQLDSNYLPLRSPAPVNSICAWLYKFQWRRIVIAIGALNALKFSVWASNAFQDVGVDKHQNFPKLAGVSTALGAMYSTAAVIDLYGVVSASIQRQMLIRVYACLAFLSALLVSAAGFLAGISYFVFSDELIHQCIGLSTSGKPRSKSMFRGEPWPVTTLSREAAQEACLSAWTSDSHSRILYTLLFYLIPSIAYFFLAYTYYRQSTDPSHAAYLCPHSPRGSAIRMGELPVAQDSPLYNGHTPPYSNDITDALRARSPRTEKGPKVGKPKGKQSGSWSGKARDKAKNVPSLTISPVMHTASPYKMTPGPPSFSVGGVSKDFGPAFFRLGSDA